MHLLCLLIDKAIEGADLLLDFEADIVGLEEVSVLFLQFLPHQIDESGFDASLEGEVIDGILLTHVESQASFDELLDVLDFFGGEFAPFRLA